MLYSVCESGAGSVAVCGNQKRSACGNVWTSRGPGCPRTLWVSHFITGRGRERWGTNHSECGSAEITGATQSSLFPQSTQWNEPTVLNAPMPAGINTACIRPRGIQSLTSSPVHRSSVSNSHSLSSRRGSIISCSQLHYGKCDSGPCCCAGSTHR